MRVFVLLFVLGLGKMNAWAQQSKYAGIWEGDLNAGVQTIRLIMFISEPAPGALLLSMQSPQQSPATLKADTCYLDAQGDLVMEMSKFKIGFTGHLQGDTLLVGKFVQGMSFPLQLKKVKAPTAITKAKRPQTPKPPFAYKSIDVNFRNNDGSINYGGTLTLPNDNEGKKFPAVLLISGSGAQDRDETILGHKPFAVIADYLTSNGIAVLRVDDRGVGKSTGNHAAATSANFADDAEAAVNFLQTQPHIDAARIGLIGHSEGGMIAPMLASRRSDIKALVLLAGPGVTGADLLTEQNVAIYQSGGMSATAAEAYGKIFARVLNAIVTASDSASAMHATMAIVSNWQVADSIKAQFELADTAGQRKYSETMVNQIGSPWMKYFLQYNPVPALKSLRCHVLALNGSKDVQVLPKSNLAGIEAALKKSRSKSFEVMELPGLNHLFQKCSTCTIDEYQKLEETFSTDALHIMLNWLRGNL